MKQHLNLLAVCHFPTLDPNPAGAACTELLAEMEANSMSKGAA